MKRPRPLWKARDRRFAPRLAFNEWMAARTLDAELSRCRHLITQKETELAALKNGLPDKLLVEPAAIQEGGISALLSELRQVEASIREQPASGSATVREGLAGYWGRRTKKQQKWAKIGGIAVAVIIILSVISNIYEGLAIQQEITEAGQLWESGSKAEAAAKYKTLLRQRLINGASQLSMVYSRVIDREADEGDAREAKELTATALDRGVSLTLTSSKANGLVAKIREEREAEEKRKQAQLANQPKSADSQVNGTLAFRGVSFVYSGDTKETEADAQNFARQLDNVDGGKSLFQYNNIVKGVRYELSGNKLRVSIAVSPETRDEPAQAILLVCADAFRRTTFRRKPQTLTLALCDVQFKETKYTQDFPADSGETVAESQPTAVAGVENKNSGITKTYKVKKSMFKSLTVELSPMVAEEVSLKEFAWEKTSLHFKMTWERNKYGTSGTLPWKYVVYDKDGTKIDSNDVMISANLRVGETVKAELWPLGDDNKKHADKIVIHYPGE